VSALGLPLDFTVLAATTLVFTALAGSLYPRMGA